MLDRALDLQDVDWLIRSETSPDEAFDIEVTGGWVTLFVHSRGLGCSRELQERCSPVTIPDFPNRSEQGDHIRIHTPPHEHALSPLEEPSHVSLLSPVPTVGSVSQETFHHYQDASPSSVIVGTLSEDVQGTAEECPSPVDDNDSSVFDTSLELFTPPEASELTLANSASALKWTADMTADNTSTRNEDVQDHTPRACSWSNFSSHTNSIISSSSSGASTIHENAPSGDTKAFHSSVQPTCISPETAPPSRTELASSSNTSTADRIPGLIHPQAEAIRGQDHLGLRPFDRPMPSIRGSAEPTSALSDRKSSSDSSLSQTDSEASVLQTSPRPPASASSAHILNHLRLTSPPASYTALRSRIDPPVAQSPLSPKHIVPTMGNRTTSPSSVPALDRIPPFPGRALSSSRVETVSQPLVVESPPASFRKPFLPAGKKQAPHVGPTPLERVRTPVETAHSSNQNYSALHRSPPPSEPTQTQVETWPPMRPADGQLRGVPVPDMKAVHLSSRSGIKSHPRKMVTHTGQRRSAFSTQINVPSVVQPSGLHSTGSLGPGYVNSTQLHTALVDSHNHAISPEHQSHPTHPEKISHQLPAPVAPRPAEKPLPPLPHAKSSNLVAISEGQRDNERAKQSRAPTPALSQPASLAGQSRTSRTDSDIELWDYDYAATLDRMRHCA